MTHPGATLVSSSDVSGTEVYSRSGENLGHIDHVMIDKQSGRVAYAVMHFGGFLGLGEEQHPVPWNTLEYDTERKGFVSDIRAEDIKEAPARQENWPGDRDWETRFHAHYGVAPYWPV